MFNLPIKVAEPGFRRSKSLRGSCDEASKGKFLMLNQQCYWWPLYHASIRSQVIQNLGFQDRIDIWRQAVTLLYRITPKQTHGLSLAPSWQISQEWIPNLQALIEYTKEFSLINRDTLKTAFVFVEVVRIHAWFLFEHGRYEEALKILHTAQDICEELLRILETFPDYPVAVSSVRLCLACVYGIKAAFTFEKNEGKESLLAKRKSMELRLQSISQDDYRIDIAKANYALREIFFGDRPYGR
ncbi:hypothetical protein NA56DRAFT_712404 [Hyaloscypha hepaticicola]|uniref:Uncharacterized protein n=1 Tax=Hyaloscypha hepaticicola TaxID=2082293 RepID=A0A2J6PGJ1_9HELO|nr:hypothetical protein NA56DRAFT_712404 [Hyaloscypha hepaticicola]